MSIIINEFKAQQVMEGAGVLVNRLFGHGQTSHFDPFLMLDYFDMPGGENSPGVPWHPHKGMETITYILKGSVKHEDSLGNAGVIGKDELQWMSAGKGIYHQEMPADSTEGGQGFQFWVNLPAKYKLKNPSYDYIKKGEMKSVFEDGSEVRVISGLYKNITGPIDKSSLGITMLHGLVDADKELTLTRSEGKQGFIFLFAGKAKLNEEDISGLSAFTLSPGQINIKAVDNIQFIYAEGRPLKEPIAWYGPVVMNTEEELRSTFKDLDDGTFVENMKF